MVIGTMWLVRVSPCTWRYAVLRELGLVPLTGCYHFALIPAMIPFILTLLIIPQPTLPDFILRGGTVYDGSGSPGVIRDVALHQNRIQSIGVGLVAGPNTVVIDVAGLIVAPGFIDLHTHSDDDIITSRLRSNLNYLTQGVTTIVTGNCGFGPVDVQAYYSAIEKHKAGSNVCHLVPHNALRRHVMGNSNRPPTPSELAKLCELTDRAMKNGAWGLATGLYYNPGTYSQIDELIALAEVAARHKGIYASHMRDEGVGLMAAVDEAITIGQRARIHVHLSHLKVYGRGQWGGAGALLSRLQQARQQGQALTADQYPYVASSTSLQATVIPARFREGSQADIVARFKDPKVSLSLQLAIKQILKECDNGRDIRLARYAPKQHWQGKDLATIASQEKRDIIDIIYEIESNNGAQIVHFSMNDEDMRLILKNEFVATASDGSTRQPDETFPHPRNYGTFSRKIGRYGIEERLISMEHAIRSASGLPADILQLPKRGYLKPGYHADVVVFDPEQFRDRATFDKPHQYSTGVVHLFVNGQQVIEKGNYQGKLAGEPLRHGSP
jgi:N-acyl-D-amino-acid deacylase